MGARLHNIREACNLIAELRTEENVNDILDFVKDVKFFARLSVLQQRSLCRTMTLEEFGPRDFVFQMGENGEKFYIILAGSVGVQVPSQTAPCPNDVHSEKCDCPNRALETVVFLEKGMGFGELALQAEAPRSATIQTSEKTELLVTKRADYEMYAGQLHRQFIEQRVKFLRQCPRIEDVLQNGAISLQDIAAMANCLNEVQLSGNAVACRQGDVVDHMIFVRSGQLAILRCVDVEQTRDASPPKQSALKSRSRVNGNVALKGDAQDQILKGLAERRDSAEDGEKPYQAQSQLTQNLAKAMMDMKRKDRKAKLDSMESNFHSEDQDEKAGPEVVEEGAKKKVLQIVTGDSEDPDSQANGKGLWKRLQTSVKAASALDRFCGGSKEAEEKDQGWQKGMEAAERNVEHFASVQAARRAYTQYTYNETTKCQKEARKQGKQRPPSSSRRKSGFSQRASISSSKALDITPKKKVRILRIGTIGPYEYFGDQQVCGSEKYPMSLVSDPVAEIYVMSKHDILRRVPKKLFSALFNLEKEAVPSDGQLLEMHKQTERWNAFRRSMHGEALGNLSARNPFTCGRDPSSGSRIDAVANLEFLGVSPSTNLGQSLLPLPDNKGVALTPKDEELFSQASARFLRRFDIMKRDPGLRDALATAGLMRNSRLHDGLPGSALDDDDQDPMAFRFEQHWYKLQKDPIGLDLDDVLSEDSSKKQLGDTSGSMGAAAASSSSASRPSVKIQRCGSITGPTDPHNKRPSVAGGGFGSPANSMGSFGLIDASGDDWSQPRPPPGRSSAAGAPVPPRLDAKRRQSMRQGSESARQGNDTSFAGSGTVELPPLDSARDGKTSSRPPSNTNSRGRAVGFSES